MDANGDGRPDLYVANDEDPNRLYLNEPGGPLGFHFVDVAKAEGVADANAGMGIAATDVNGDGKPTSSSRTRGGRRNAAYASDGTRLHGRAQVVRRSASTRPAGATRGSTCGTAVRVELVVANGAIPVTNLRKDAAPPAGAARRTGSGFVDSGLLRSLESTAAASQRPTTTTTAASTSRSNSIGGPLLLLHNTSPAGNWLEVQVEPFSPGAVVTVVDSRGRRQARAVQAGSSYLSSEDPRVHFGFGKATPCAR